MRDVATTSTSILGKVATKRGHRFFIFVVLEKSAWTYAEDQDEGDDDGASSTQPPAQIVLELSNTTFSFGYANGGPCDASKSLGQEFLTLLIPGCAVQADGSIGTTKTGQRSLFASHVSLLTAPSDCDSATVHRTLSLSHRLPASISATAGFLCCKVEVVQRAWDAISSGNEPSLGSHLTAICTNLKDPQRRKKHLPQRIRGPTRYALAHWENALENKRLFFPLEEAPISEDLALSVAGSDPAVRHVLTNLPDVDNERRMEYMMKKKLPQVVWMVQQTKNLLEMLPAPEIMHAAGAPPRRVVLDIGGGRGDLSIALAKSLPSVKVVVIDINVASLDAAKAVAEREGVMDIMGFVHGDIRDPAVVKAILGGESGPPSIVTALHACGGLADATLELAKACGASFLVCTCCFRSHRQMVSDTYSSWVTQLESSACGPQLPSLSLLKQLVNSPSAEAKTLGDGAPQQTSDLPDEFGLIQRLALSDGDEDLVKRAAKVINSLRLSAMRDLLFFSQPGLPMPRGPDLRLLHFPRSYSPCNQVLWCNTNSPR